MTHLHAFASRKEGYRNMVLLCVHRRGLVGITSRDVHICVMHIRAVDMNVDRHDRRFCKRQKNWVLVKQFPCSTMMMINHPLPRHVVSAPIHDFNTPLNTQRGLLLLAVAAITTWTQLLQWKLKFRFKMFLLKIDQKAHQSHYLISNKPRWRQMVFLRSRFQGCRTYIVSEKIEVFADLNSPFTAT